jgi:diadenosine tetraphosphatase ApaH/serine/threonine PP2A family protein phosphatase
VDPRTHSDLFKFYLAKRRVELMGLGHTHVPYVWKERSGSVFNPGSVGQPRDGDRRASFAIISSLDGSVEIEARRVEYDYEGAASRIRAAGLPGFFADRLYSGI